MQYRPDLTFKREVSKTPFLYTNAGDIDEAIDIARKAISDVIDFREYAKATGTDVVKREPSPRAIACSFAAGAVSGSFALFAILAGTGVI